MKKLVFSAMIGAMAFAAVAAGKTSKDPNAFASYGAGMASDKQYPMAVEWHNTNRVALDAKASDDAVAAFAEDADAAKALLAKVKGAYATDPMVAVQVAAVSQYVMTLKGGFSLAFWKTSVAPERELWSAALLKRAEDASDAYVQQFCIDQLRWCGLKCQAAAIAAIGEKSSDKGVKDLAYIASKELSR